MTAPRRARGRRRKARVPPWVATILLVAVTFAAGVAVGQALHDNPKPGGTQTLERTFRP